MSVAETMTDQPPIIIFCPFTRLWAVDRWLSGLAEVKHDPAMTSLAAIVDIDEPQIISKLEKFVKQHGYKDFQFIINKDWHPNEVRISSRRGRIADVKTQSKLLISKLEGDIIVSFEDDTVFQPFDLYKLYGHLIETPNVGFVQGVQAGRWGAKMIGAWVADDPHMPAKMQTILPGQGVEEITAGGFYGYATRRDLYIEHNYHWHPSHPWGPDVNFGLWLRQNGYKCLVDWGIIFGHNDHNKLIWPTGKLTEVRYTLDDMGKWFRNDKERVK